MADIKKINTQILPTAFVDKISLNSVYANNVLASTEVQLLLSLKTTKSANIDFFQNISTTNVLSISLLQVTDVNLYSFLSLSKELVYYAVYGNKITQMPIEILQIAYNRNLISTKPTRSNLKICLEEIKALFLDKTKINKKTISNFSLAGIHKRVEQLESGEEVLNVYFRESFNIALGIEHLSYFVFCDYDDLQLRNQGVLLQNGTDIKVNCEVVINNNELVSQTYTYTLTDGTIWTGYAHRDPNSANQWKTGNLNDPPSSKQPLIRKIYYNTKIQDLRTVSRLQKAQRRSQNVSEELLLKILKIQFKPKKLSPIKFDSTLTNGIKVSLNVERLLEKHSPLYSFITRLQLDNYDWIKNVIAYRKRVKLVNGVLVDFTKNEEPVFISAGLIEKTSPSMGIIEYRIRDVSLDSISTGEYCYGINIKFVDYILQKLELQLQKLLQKEIIGFLSRYEKEARIVQSENGAGNYISDIDMFTQEFISKYSNNPFIVSAVEIFVDSFNMISAEQIENTSTIKKNLLLQLTPNTANPDSISAFIKLYNSLAESYEKIILTAKSSILEEEMYFSLEGQQVVKTARPARPTPVSDNQIENSIVSSLRLMAEKFSVSFEKLETTTQRSVKVLNNQGEIIKQNTESAVLSIFDFVDKTAYLAKQIDAAVPKKEVLKPDTNVAVLQVKRESSNQILEANKTLSNVKSPTPAKDVIFKETPKISRMIPQEQPVQIQNISRAVAASPTTYTTTGKVSGETIQDVVNKMLRARSKRLLNRRG